MYKAIKTNIVEAWLVEMLDTTFPGEVTNVYTPFSLNS